MSKAAMLGFASSLIVLNAAAAAQNAPILQPGAPGEKTQELSAEDAIKVAESSYSPDDVAFMQDMIPHHHQAVEMSALVAKRTNNPEIIDIAGRITTSQDDEIAFMRDWLTERGRRAPDPAAHHAMKTSHKMAGMASKKQMRELARAKGVAFDRMFLELMIRHHDGAVQMVEHLHAQPGSAYDPILFEFTNEIVNGQVAEIERMNAILVGLSTDPRATLSAGYADAGSAILNLAHVAALPKPTGFFDPNNPAGLPPKAPQEEKEIEEQEEEEAEEEETPRSDENARAPLLSFANTDMAFSGDVLVAGSYHGFNVYKLKADAVPEHISSIVCPGGQGDVSIVGDILIMSVEQTRGRVDCGLEGVSEDVSAERFRGLRIFDVSDWTRPRQVGQVQTCRGSHTHSVVSGPGADGKIIVYNSGTSVVRDEKELAGCYGETPGDNRTALFRIDVIEIPVADPSKARIVHSPAVFADPETGRLAGLWRGGDHGDDTQETYRTDQCHDITVFPSAKIAAGACSGNGILFDISDPRAPKRIDAVIDEGFAYWHSATFNNDGTKVLFTDEWGGGSRPRCRAHDPEDWGANAIYDIVDGELKFRSYFKLPAPQVDSENCVAHNGSIVPVPGRDIFVQSWYQGGVSVIDFTDSANPVEIAYFDRGPVDEKELVLGGFWSSYWYDGRIYATEIARGLDIFELTPSEFLSANEIAAAKSADQASVFNPQQQFPVTWPADPVVARAYLDQLARADAIDEKLARDVEAALESAEDGDTAELRSAASALKQAQGDMADHRAALAATMESIAARME